MNPKMSRPRSEGTPRLGRFLATLIRGEGAECLRGDLEETYRRGRLDYARNAWRSLLNWYRPGEIRRRSRRRKRQRMPEGSTPGPGRGPGMSGWGADLRFALRALRRRPGFGILVMLTLGLGIGATTTIFSVVDGVVLRPLPYDHADRIVSLGNTFPGREWSDQVDGLQRLAGVSYLNFTEIARRSGTLELVAAGEWGNVLLPDEGNGPQLATLLRVTPGFFRLLGVAPAMGRTFMPPDFTEAPEQTVILSHGAWVSRFGADPSIVGRTIQTAGTAMTVVGVLPADFKPPEALFPPGTEFWMPLDPTHPRYAERGRRSLSALGLLAAGRTLDQARAELASLGEALAREFPDGNVFPDGTRFSWGANPLQADTVGGTGRTLLIFLAASGLILVIAVLNAAHLLLVRGLDRRGELALRQAVGAGRWAVHRNLLAESLVLSLAGGGLGLLMAQGGVGAFLRFVPSNMPRLAEVAVDLRVVWVCGVVSVGVGILTGLVPALVHARTDLSRALKEGGARAVSASGHRSRMLMVSAQLALAVVLAVASSLLFESFLRVRAVDPGFDPENLLTFSMPMKTPESADEVGAWMAWDRLMREVDAVPGVRAAAGSNLPFESLSWAPGVLLPGEPLDTRRSGIGGHAITPDYLEVLGIPLLAGRELSASDGPDAPGVVLVNRAFVREVLRVGAGSSQPAATDGELAMTAPPADRTPPPASRTVPAADQASPANPRTPLTDRTPHPEADLGSVVGREVLFRAEGEGNGTIAYRIVGVVGDVVQARAEEPKGPALYVPYTQTDWDFNVRVAVRTERDPSQVAPELRQAAGRFFGAFPVTDLTTMRARIGATRTEPRFQALLLLSFAAVAVLLSAVGLYGTLAHMVGRRRRELGIRMALGADRAAVLGLVLKQAGLATVLGIGVGLAGALLLTRFLGGFLFQIGALHVPAFVLGTAVLAAVAAVAAVGPAHRASRVDLVESLREE